MIHAMEGLVATAKPVENSNLQRVGQRIVSFPGLRRIDPRQNVVEPSVQDGE